MDANKPSTVANEPNLAETLEEKQENTHKPGQEEVSRQKTRNSIIRCTLALPTQGLQKFRKFRVAIIPTAFLVRLQTFRHSFNPSDTDNKQL